MTGCVRCTGGPSDGSGEDTTSVPAARTALPPATPPPAEWTFSSVRMPTGVAVPERCRYRAPLLSADVPETTHFSADPRTPSLLVAADTRLDPPAVLRSGELLFADRGTVSSGAWVPWPDPRSAPRLARAPQSFAPQGTASAASPPATTTSPWIGAWDVPWKKGDTEVILYRSGDAVSLGRGDAYTAADLACGASRCALLTSRKGRVAPAGATLFLLDADPTTPPRTVTIEPEGESTARPFGLASVDAPNGPISVLTDSGQAVFWTAEGAAGPTVLARLPAEHGLLDAALLADRPLILAHGNVVDERGCAREGSDARGAKLRIVRSGQPPIDVSTPGAPSLVALRPLPTGALVLWLSPLGCGAERHVVYGLVLDATLAPAGEPIPLADADTFAAATQGDSADLWIRRREHLFWLRLTCAP